MKQLLLCTLVIGLGTFCSAQAPSIDIGYNRLYLGGDTGVLISKDPTVNISLTWAGRDGYFNIWRSFDAGGNPGYGNEIDFSVGKTLLRTKGWSISGEAAYIGLYPLTTVPGDLLSFKVVFASERGTWRPYLSLQRMLPTDVETLKGGGLYRLGVRHFFKQGAVADLSAVGHDGVFGRRPESLSSLRLKLFVPFGHGKNAMSGYITYQRGVGHSDGLSPRSCWVAGCTLRL
ncbi:MAG: hypothetical protein Q7K33_04025 [Candidatus Berkelbacteria bacterium]|nr:hypothetical protein [Candidatus Berkelbacteria bacterium]